MFNVKLEESITILRRLSDRLAAVRREGWGDTASRLDVTPTEAGVAVHWLLNEDAMFQPDCDNLVFTEIYRALGSPVVAPWLSELNLEGHEIAANGTIAWEVAPIAYTASIFRRLRVLRFDGGYSSGELLGANGKDETVARRLLKVMPALEELAVPEPARELAFFIGPPHPLRILEVDDVDLYPFVAPLAKCRRFPDLQELHLHETVRTDVCPRVPAVEYRQLFESSNFPKLKAVTLKQVGLSDKQKEELARSSLGSQLESLKITSAESWCGRPILCAGGK